MVVSQAWSQAKITTPLRNMSVYCCEPIILSCTAIANSMIFEVNQQQVDGEFEHGYKVLGAELINEALGLLKGTFFARIYDKRTTGDAISCTAFLLNPLSYDSSDFAYIDIREANISPVTNLSYDIESTVLSWLPPILLTPNKNVLPYYTYQLQLDVIKGDNSYPYASLELDQPSVSLLNAALLDCKTLRATITPKALLRPEVPDGGDFVQDVNLMDVIGPDSDITFPALVGSYYAIRSISADNIPDHNGITVNLDLESISESGISPTAENIQRRCKQRLAVRFMDDKEEIIPFNASVNSQSNTEAFFLLDCQDGVFNVSVQVLDQDDEVLDERFKILSFRETGCLIPSSTLPMLISTLPHSIKSTETERLVSGSMTHTPSNALSSPIQSPGRDDGIIITASLVGGVVIGTVVFCIGGVILLVKMLCKTSHSYFKCY